MTRVWEPIVIGAFTAIVGIVVAAVGLGIDPSIPALYWLGYVLAGIGGWFLLAGAVALGVQLGNRDR